MSTFFASWSKSDPLFQEYDKDSRLLISPGTVPSTWNTGRWKIFPEELMVDCGAFSGPFSKIKSVREIFTSQLTLLKGWDFTRPTYLVHPDYFLPLRSTGVNWKELVNRSLDNAEKYISLIKKSSLNVKPVGVIQGLDEETLVGSYEVLKNLGYTNFALGSLARRISLQKNLSLTLINTALKNVLPSRLHILGVNIPWLGNDLFSMKVSFDTSAPVKMAYNGYILDLRWKKKINVYSKKNFSPYFRDSLCKCEGCTSDPSLLLHERKTGKWTRAIHNYYQIKMASYD